MATHLEKEAAKKSFALLYYAYDDKEGVRRYVYLGLRLGMLDPLREAVMKFEAGGEPVEFAKYALVLAEGEGAPTPEVMERMHQEYAFNHESPVPIPLKPKSSVFNAVTGWFGSLFKRTA